MRLACMAGNHLCSHAGFSPVWVNPPTVENILARCKLAEERAVQGVLDPVFGYGELPGACKNLVDRWPWNSPWASTASRRS